MFRRRLIPAALTGCLLIGGFVRTLGLAERSLWFDEAYTWRMAQQDESQILERLRFDNNPPLYYLLLKYWVDLFGDSLLALRSLSVLSGLAVVLGVYLFTRDLIVRGEVGECSSGRNRWIPILAAALVALSPIQVRYSWEARMYAPGTALAVFSAWTLLRAVDAKRRHWGWWLAFSGLSLLFLYTHTFAVVTLAIEAVIVGWHIYRGSAGFPAAVAPGIVGLAFLPWLPSLEDQMDFPHTRRWIPSLTSYRQVCGIVHQLLIDPADQFPSTGVIAVGVAAIATTIAIAAVWRGRRAEWWALALGAGPLLIGVAMSLAGTQVLIARYFVFGQPFLLVLLALAIGRIRNRMLFALAAVAALAVHAYWCSDFWTQMELSERSGFRGAAEFIQAKGGEDWVLTSDGMTYFPMRYHLRGRLHVYGAFSGGAGSNAADKEREFLRPDQLATIPGQRLWVINREADGRPTQTVSVPGEWRKRSECRFNEVFGMATVVVIEYEKQSDK